MSADGILSLRPLYSSQLYAIVNPVILLQSAAGQFFREHWKNRRRILRTMMPSIHGSAAGHRAATQVVAMVLSFSEISFDRASIGRLGYL